MLHDGQGKHLHNAFVILRGICFQQEDLVGIILLPALISKLNGKVMVIHLLSVQKIIKKICFSIIRGIRLLFCQSGFQAVGQKLQDLVVPRI